MSKINVTSVSFDKSKSSINMKMLFKDMKMTGGPLLVDADADAHAE